MIATAAASLAGLLLWVSAGAVAATQQLPDPIGNLSAPRPVSRGHVSYSGAQEQEVAAGKRATLHLHFQVEEGFHINSHTPRSELLIPTVFTAEPGEGVQLAPPTYPEGSSYSFAFDPKSKLSVYTGEFGVTLPVIASSGEHTVRGLLHYQACDRAACYPPRTLPVEVSFRAR